MSVTRMPPPHRRHITQPISTTTALDKLSTYLDSTSQYAHLHPDAILTASGVNFGATGSNGGVVLHNLRRLQAGLRGELLLPEPKSELELEDEGQAEVEEVAQQRLQGDGSDADMPDAATVAATQETLDPSDQPDQPDQPEGDDARLDAIIAQRQAGMQEQSEDEIRAKAIDIGEVGPRHNAIESQGRVPKIQELDKEARKKQKKERRKAEKSQTKEERRAKKEGKRKKRDGDGA